MEPYGTPTMMPFSSLPLSTRSVSPAVSRTHSAWGMQRWGSAVSANPAWTKLACRSSSAITSWAASMQRRSVAVRASRRVCSMPSWAMVRCSRPSRAPSKPPSKTVSAVPATTLCPPVSVKLGCRAEVVKSYFTGARCYPQAAFVPWWRFLEGYLILLFVQRHQSTRYNPVCATRVRKGATRVRSRLWITVPGEAGQPASRAPPKYETRTLGRTSRRNACRGAIRRAGAKSACAGRANLLEQRVGLVRCLAFKRACVFAIQLASTQPFRSRCRPASGSGAGSVAGRNDPPSPVRRCRGRWLPPHVRGWPWYSPARRGPAAPCGRGSQ